MNDQIESLIEQIKEKEKELEREVRKKEIEFLYKIHEKKIRFSEETTAAHRKLVTKLHRYVLNSRLIMIVAFPFIWICLIPFALLDLATTVYQAVCFPIFGIPKVLRSDYIAIDRHRLSYLNGIEKLNCAYCSYANGLLGYLVEMTGRTEQHWCPIKHALRKKFAHSRHKYFLDYGDAESYRQRIETVRRSFEDLEETLAEPAEEVGAES